MPLAAILTLTIGYAPNDVVLKDLRQFEITAAELNRRKQTIVLMREFIRDQLDPREDGAYREYRRLGEAYVALDVARNPTVDLQERLSWLRGLRKVLGEKAYYAGSLPPVQFSKYQRAFERWQADEKAGRKRKPNGVLKDPT